MSRKYRVQEPPFCVQVELCEGCNLRCAFCGLQGIRAVKEKNYKFMTEETIVSLFGQLSKLSDWNPRVEFAMHGEPTMHPDYVGMVRAAHAAAPRLQLMMTSNAGGLLRKPGPAANVRALFDAGLTMLALDDYEGAGYVPKVRESLSLSKMSFDDVKYYEYPRDADGNPHSRRSRKALSFVRDIAAATNGTHATLSNHAGSGSAPLAEPMSARCAKPFRELSVRWDGNVAMCCNDWRGVHKCGSVVADGVEAVWQSVAMGAARELLYAGDRDFGPCAGCDAKTYRNGLLPDQLGKESLPRPTAKTRADAAAACAGAPYTAPALRPWEVK